MTLASEDTDGQARVAAFLQGLQEVGWAVGRNLHIDIKWGVNTPERTRRDAAELIALQPDVILATGSSTVGPLLELTRSVPVVFVIVIDPVGAGYAASLAQPGGNATGFIQLDYALCGKWVELLKQVAPDVNRIAVIWDPAISAGAVQVDEVKRAAGDLNLTVVPVSVRHAAEIQRELAGFAASPHGGMIVTSSPLAAIQRDLIVALATQHRLPTVAYERSMVAKGGLISYGPDFIDQYRRSVHYVDRVLKGERPADLPVQAPTVYELAINLGTARALGLVIPASLLARADEIIE